MAESTSLDYLIPELRLRLGDIDPSSYRYLDEWLLIALRWGVKFLGRWWNFKYLVDTQGSTYPAGNVYRNPNTVFLFPEPPVIEPYDESIIVLASSILVQQGSLENGAWGAVSWRDAEISFSNLEGSRSRQEGLKAAWEELFSLITPPTKRLARPLKSSHPGYKKNKYEVGTDY